MIPGELTDGSQNPAWQPVFIPLDALEYAPYIASKMRYGKTYSELCDIQRTVKSTLESITCKGGEVAQLARAWIECEAFKREMRGVPRLRSCDMQSLLRDARAKPATLDAPLEAEAQILTEQPANPSPARENVTTDPPNPTTTVTAMPPPTPPKTKR